LEVDRPFFKLRCSEWGERLMIAKRAMKIVVKFVVRDTFDKQKILRLKRSPLESAAAGGDWLKVTRFNAMSVARAD
jgi:hypothetical protein